MSIQNQTSCCRLKKQRIMVCAGNNLVFIVHKQRIESRKESVIRALVHVTCASPSHFLRLSASNYANPLSIF